MQKQEALSSIKNSLKTFARSAWFGPAMVVLCFAFLLTVRLQVNLPTFGDEPHYLVMNSSLLNDGDLNLKNNYENRDYAPYFESDLPPQGAPPKDATDIRSIHGSGLTVLTMPGYALGGKWGVAVQMVMLATLTVWLTYVWTKQLTNSKRLAYITAGVLTITYFFSNLAGYIYPDMAVAAAALAGLIIVQRHYRNPRFQVILGIVMGVLILVHFRTLILVAPVFVILMYKLWRAERKLPWLAFLAFSVFGAYYYYETYMTGASIAPSVGSSSASLTGNIFLNASAMLFDSNKGLFAFNPILLLLVVGLPIWFKEHRESLVMAALVLLPTIATTVMFIEWHGGYAPTGRYMMAFLPAFMPAFAFALSKFQFAWQKIVTWILGIVTFVITLDAMRSHFPLIDPNTWTRHRLFDHIQHATGIAADKVLPAFITTLPSDGDITMLVGTYSGVKLVFWYAVIAGLLFYGYVLSRAPAPASTKPAARSRSKKIASRTAAGTTRKKRG